MDKPGQQVCNPTVAITDALNHFRDVNDSYPDQVIIYRDAGSGANPNSLKSTEVAQIEQAIKAVSEDIKLLYVLVAKKTNVELYAQGFYADSYKNIVPGTVIDSQITSPSSLHEFFLVSTTQKFGFPHPTRYSVLYDSIGQTVDKLHLLTYKMCHTYFNIP